MKKSYFVPLFVLTLLILSACSIPSMDTSQCPSNPTPVNSEDTHPLLKKLRNASLFYRHITAFSNGTAWLDYDISYYPLDDSGNSTTHIKSFSVCFDKLGKALYQYEDTYYLGTSGEYTYLSYHEEGDAAEEKDRNKTQPYVLVLNSVGDVAYSVPYSYDNDSIEGYYNGYLFVYRRNPSEPSHYDIFDPSGNLVNTLYDSDFIEINSDMAHGFRIHEIDPQPIGRGVFRLDATNNRQLLYSVENHCVKAIKSDASLVFRAEYALTNVSSDRIQIIGTFGDEYFVPIPSDWISTVGQANLLWDGWIYNDYLFHPSGYSYNIFDGQSYSLSEKYQDCLPEDCSYATSDGTVALEFTSNDGNYYVTVFNMESWEPVSEDITGRLFSYRDKTLFIRNDYTGDIEVYSLDGEMLYSFMENEMELFTDSYELSAGDGVIRGETWYDTLVLPYFDLTTGKRLFEQIDFSDVATCEFSPD